MTSTPSAVGRLRGFLRHRLPAAFAFYKRHLRRYVARRDPHYVIASWVSEGLALRGGVGLADVVLDADGAWFIEPGGLQWRFDPAIWDPTLGAATGDAHEPALIDEVCATLDNAGVVVDVGANVGRFALAIARLTGARVIAIEPVSTTFALLNDNVRRNRADGTVTTIRAAVGSSGGEVVMTTGAQAANHVLSGVPAARADEETVSVITLDDVLEDEARVDLIKIDIEGMELEALRGAQRTIDRHGPTVLLEIEERWTTRYGHVAHHVFEHMHALGYEYRAMTESGPVAATTVDADLGRTNNFWFTRSAAPG